MVRNKQKNIKQKITAMEENEKKSEKDLNLNEVEPVEESFYDRLKKLPAEPFDPKHPRCFIIMRPARSSRPVTSEKKED